METQTMMLIAIGAACAISAFSILRLRKSSENNLRDIATGAVVQSTLIGLVVGFLMVPNGPPPPALGQELLWLLLAILLIELVRTGLYLRLPFVPRACVRYRLAAARLRQAEAKRAVERLEALADN